MPLEQTQFLRLCYPSLHFTYIDMNGAPKWQVSQKIIQSRNRIIWVAVRPQKLYSMDKLFFHCQGKKLRDLKCLVIHKLG